MKIIIYMINFIFKLVFVMYNKINLRIIEI